MIVIMEKVNRPHPRFPNCGMLIPWIDLNLHHPTTALCARGADQKRWRMVE